MIETAPAFEPYRVKAVEPLGFTTRGEREAVLREAGWNLFRVPADKVLIDLLTDSGTSAMSAEMWAALMRGDESYAGARSWYRFERVLRELTGMPHILPTHQGRASERILFELIGGLGKVIPSNNHFDTTRANIEHSGARAVDLVIDEGTRPRSQHPFKGNLDPRKLERLIADFLDDPSLGAKRVPGLSGVLQDIDYQGADPPWIDRVIHGGRRGQRVRCPDPVLREHAVVDCLYPDPVGRQAAALVDPVRDGEQVLVRQAESGIIALGGLVEQRGLVDSQVESR